MKQTEKTWKMLSSGWLTALGSAQMGGCLSLSQRVGEWRRGGHNIVDKWVTTGEGARVKAYRLVERKKA